MGFVRMLVLDQEGTPVPNVNSCASLGSNAFTCAFTPSDGVMEHPVPVGMRRTWVEPPEGYAQGSDPLEQVVEVVKDRTTQVEFRLVRTNEPEEIGAELRRRGVTKAPQVRKTLRRFV